MKMTLSRFTDEAEAVAHLGHLAADASRAIRVTAYEQVAEWGDVDPVAETATLIRPEIVAEGYWLLYADEDGSDPLVLPAGVISVSPVFAGMH